MRTVVASVEGEFRRYKAIAEGAFAQLQDGELSAPRAGAADGTASENDNSVAVIVWHISGNLVSRFTEFLTSDGEKPWRHRDEEFVAREVSRHELVEKWERGWSVLFATLGTLTDEQLSHVVHIRRQPLPVVESLHRALAHVAYHVGQIVLIAKTARGGAWRSLSIPLGQSEQYTHAPVKDKPASALEK